MQFPNLPFNPLKVTLVTSQLMSIKEASPSVAFKQESETRTYMPTSCDGCAVKHSHTTKLNTGTLGEFRFVTWHQHDLSINMWLRHTSTILAGISQAAAGELSRNNCLVHQNWDLTRSSTYYIMKTKARNFQQIIQGSAIITPVHYEV